MARTRKTDGVSSRGAKRFEAEHAARAVDRGTFVLHKFQQPIGEERYEWTRTGDSHRVRVDFRFKDRGEEVALTSTFRSSVDLSPTFFEVDGKNCRQAEIHRTVEVRPRDVRLRDREAWTRAPRPRRFITIAGYAPITMQMLLVRYWAGHGSPAVLRTLPTGIVRIVRRGQDVVRYRRRPVRLVRYSIEGLIWGRETVWLDAKGDLVAAVTIDAELDHFEAVRKGYEKALGDLLRSAGSDGMAALHEVSRRIAPGRPELVAIVHANLIDGTGRPAIPDATVVVRGDRILAAGPRSEVTIPRGAKVLGARGKSLLPGLWDMHAHFQQVEWGPIYLAAGVTTVRDCANELEFVTAVRDAIEAGRGLGPRILAAGVVDGNGPYAVGVARVESAGQAERWVRRYHDAGFQQMKVYSSMKLGAVRALARAAHRRGMTVTGHVPNGLKADQVVRAGQDQVNHLHFVLDMMTPPQPKTANWKVRMRAMGRVDLDSPRARRAFEFLKSRRTVVDPTVALMELMTATTTKPTNSFEPGVDRVPDELANRLVSLGPPTERTLLMDAVFRKALEVLGRLHRDGVPIVAGTDQAVPGHTLHRELELYVHAGMSPLEAIQSATIVPARVMGLEAELGTVEVGMRADLLIVDGNPLESISDVRKTSSVMTGGKVYRCADLWRAVGFRA